MDILGFVVILNGDVMKASSGNPIPCTCTTLILFQYQVTDQVTNPVSLQNSSEIYRK